MNRFLNLLWPKQQNTFFRKSPALMFVLSVHLQKKAQWFPPFFLTSVLLKTSRKTSLNLLTVALREHLSICTLCNMKFLDWLNDFDATKSSNAVALSFQINLAKCFWSARNYCPQKSVKLGLPSSFLISFLNLKIQRSFNWLNRCYDKM